MTIWIGCFMAAATALRILSAQSSLGGDTLHKTLLLHSGPPPSSLCVYPNCTPSYMPSPLHAHLGLWNRVSVLKHLLLSQKAPSLYPPPHTHTLPAAVPSLSHHPPSLHSNRSVSQLLLGKHQEALSDAKQACQLKPDWEKGHFRCGAALEAMGDLAKVCVSDSDTLSCLHIKRVCQGGAAWPAEPNCSWAYQQQGNGPWAAAFG